jgi:uncharacterized membrane protein
MHKQKDCGTMEEKERMIDRLFNPMLDALEDHPYSGMLVIAFVCILIVAFFPPSLVFILIFIGYGFYLNSKRSKKDKP